MRARIACVLSLAAIIMSGAARAADLSDPRKTLQTLQESMASGDVTTAAACFVYHDAEAEEMARVNLAQKWAPRALVAAAVAKWGPDARKVFVPDVQDKYLEDLAALVASAEITVEGDLATVGKKREANPNAETELTGVQLKKTGAEWKIVADTFGDIASDMRPRALALMKSLQEATSKACAQVSREIAAGKYATAQAAYDAYTARLQEAVRAAATLPTTATAPSSRPAK